jgi:hypothetical protein
VTRAGGGRGAATITVAAVCPGIFTASSDGTGPPAAFVVLAKTHLLQFATEDPCNLLILLGGVVSDAKM